MNTQGLPAVVWSLFRMVIGLLFSLHGAATVLGLFGGSAGSGKALEVGVWPGWWAGLIQLACGILVLLGLFTRPAALLASGSMAYAYFVVHQPEALMPAQNGGVQSALYAWAFLVIAALGAGKWSLDALWGNRPGVGDESGAHSNAAKTTSNAKTGERVSEPANI